LRENFSVVIFYSSQSLDRSHSMDACEDHYDIFHKLSYFKYDKPDILTWLCSSNQNKIQCQKISCNCLFNNGLYPFQCDDSFLVGSSWHLACYQSYRPAASFGRIGQLTINPFFPRWKDFSLPQPEEILHLPHSRAVLARDGFFYRMILISPVIHFPVRSR
jgi:hypothetical protein